MIDFDQISRNIISVRNVNGQDLTEACAKLKISLDQLRQSGEISFCDVLMLIFSLTDEDFRRRHFKYLMEYYYERLSCSADASQVVTSKYDYRRAVAALLPIVKLQLVSNLIEQGKTEEVKCQEILEDISKYVKCPRLNKEDVSIAIANKLRSVDYRLLDYHLTPLDQRNGYLGDYYNLALKVSQGEETNDLQMFAKFAVKFRWEVLSRAGSEREEFFYSTILRFFETHGLDQIMDFAPEVYFIRSFDVVLMDDLAKSGYVAYDSTVMLSYQHLRLAVSQLAKLHACSFAIEETHSVRLNELYPNRFEEIAFKESDPWFINGVDGTLHMIDKCQLAVKVTKTEEFKEKVRRAFESFFEKIKSSERYRNAICHADMYGPNIMFKHDENDVPNDCRLVDFQMLRYCPPAHDVMFCIYINSTKEMRDAYMSALLREYYTEISKNLRMFYVDVNSVYTPDEFDKSCRYMKSQAICQALLYSHFNKCPSTLKKQLLSDDEIRLHYEGNRKEFLDIAFKSDLFRSVQEGLLEDLYQVCQNEDV
ncbi:uncharacterized protein LOC132696326 [Cylas formicarius]|uniref:uncharacterized protein LOC132696326 n=1 Tax=Cylas formicarius TaxID=197179 RepID=UPI002958B247|nr:uncharacterized protein LOC132696326 [Cylas formicarius]